jgi:hypothetical protein
VGIAGRGRKRRRASDDEVIDLRDDEHAWWAERTHVSGVPVDRARERIREEQHRQATAEAAAAYRRWYWSAERLLTPSPAGADDPFEVLGLGPGATLAEATRARRRLAKLYHPDLAEDDAARAHAAAKMAKVNAAYEQVRFLLQCVPDPEVSAGPS